MLILISVALAAAGVALAVRSVRGLRRSPRQRSSAGLLLLSAALVILATMGVRAGWQLPFYAVLAVCRSNLGWIGGALALYHEANQQYPPTLQPLVSERYVIDLALRCPLSESQAASYAYVPSLSPADPNDWIIAFDARGNHEDGSRHALYIGGAVQLLDAAGFENELRRFRTKFKATRGQDPRVVESGRP
jgi:hypothetical protein